MQFKNMVRAESGGNTSAISHDLEVMDATNEVDIWEQIKDTTAR
jgi:hypothetical protein